MPSSQDPGSQRRPLVLFFLLAYALTWLRWIPEAASARGLIDLSVPEHVVFIAGYGPAIAAIVVTALVAGRRGLRTLLGRLIRWRVDLRWYVVALLLPATISLVTIGLHRLFGGQMPAAPGGAWPVAQPDSSLWQQALILFLVFTLGFDGLGEELGWRGFALPRLQASQSAVIASLVIGLLWALWHLPYALTPDSVLSSVPLGWLLIDVIASSILYTWIFNHTGGSVLLTILFHAAGNTTAFLLPVLPTETDDPSLYLVSIGVRWLVAITVIVVAGPSHLSRTVPADAPSEAAARRPTP